MAIVLTLGVGLGANAAVFSLIEALLLRPLPFPDGDRLVQVFSLQDGARGRLSIREIADLNEQARLFDGFAAYRDSAYNLDGDGLPAEHVRIVIATANLFDVLGIPPLVGSSWAPENDWRRAFEVVVSHDLWVRRYGGDRSAIGRQVQMDAYPNTIRGVMPPGFAFPRRQPVFRCWGIAGTPGYYERREERTGWGVARLKPGVSLAQARADVEAVGRHVADAHPTTNATIQFGVAPLRDVYVGGAVPYLWLLGGAVACVWLIACVNVANLLLSRAIVRRRDLAVRLAMGAGRGRLAVEVVLDTLLICLLSACAALIMMHWTAAILETLLPSDLPPWMAPRVNGTVVAFVIAFGVLSAAVAALVPFWWMGRRDPIDDLRFGGRSTTDARPVRAALISAQVALAILLASAAVLTLRSFDNLMRVDVGFDPKAALTLRTGLSWNKYGREKARRFAEDVVREIRRIPGVDAATYNSNLPLTGYTLHGPVAIEGQLTASEITRNPLATIQSVGHDYHRLLGIPLVVGRLFDAADRIEATRVALVSRRFAQRFWPGKDPIGKRLLADGVSIEQPRWSTVVGVVGDVRCLSPVGEACLDVYTPFAQAGSQSPFFVVRSRVSPAALIPAVREAVARVDPGEPISEVAMYDEAIAGQVWERRTVAVASAAFAAVALLLAAIGIYGVMSYSVARRYRELAIRATLGATPAILFRLVVVDGLRLTAPGLVLGVTASAALGAVTQSLFYGVRAQDPTTFAGVGALLVALTIIACWLPARRSATADPAATLRQE